MIFNMFTYVYTVTHAYLPVDLWPITSRAGMVVSRPTKKVGWSTPQEVSLSVFDLCCVSFVSHRYWFIPNYPLVMTNSSLWKMAHWNRWFTELQDGGSFQFAKCKRLPEGNHTKIAFIPEKSYGTAAEQLMGVCLSEKRVPKCSKILGKL